MSPTPAEPTALRATASLRPSRWRRAPDRWVRVDALWPGGRVEPDVDPVALFYCRAPADYTVFRRALDDATPEVGSSPWINSLGGVIDGPPPAKVATSSDGVTGVSDAGGRRLRYRPEPPLNPRFAARRTRVGLALGGLGGIAVGAVLLTTGAASGATGLVGALCLLFGLAAVSGAWRRH